jgi:hypothetical protein
MLGSLHVFELPLLDSPDKEEPASHTKEKRENEEENERSIHV